MNDWANKRRQKAGRTVETANTAGQKKATNTSNVKSITGEKKPV
jgi:hypothetical protein